MKGWREVAAKNIEANAWVVPVRPAHPPIGPYNEWGTDEPEADEVEESLTFTEVLWHGTTPGRAAAVRDAGFQGNQTFLTSAKVMARDLGDGAVVPVKVKLENPFLVDLNTSVKDALTGADIPFAARGGYLEDSTIEVLQARGYDGMVAHYHEDLSDPANPLPERMVVRAFDPRALTALDEGLVMAALEDWTDSNEQFEAETGVPIEWAREHLGGDNQSEDGGPPMEAT